MLTQMTLSVREVKPDRPFHSRCHIFFFLEGLLKLFPYWTPVDARNSRQTLSLSKEKQEKTKRIERKEMPIDSKNPCKERVVKTPLEIDSFYLKMSTLFKRTWLEKKLSNEKGNVNSIATLSTTDSLDVYFWGLLFHTSGFCPLNLEKKISLLLSFLFQLTLNQLRLASQLGGRPKTLDPDWKFLSYRGWKSYDPLFWMT